MDIRTIWSLAEAGYSLSAIASITVTGSLWTRTPRGFRSTFLCGSLLTLALVFTCFAVDAFSHAVGATERAFTIASAFGNTALVVSGSLFVGFLLTTITHHIVVPFRRRWVVRTVIADVGLASVIALSMAGRLLWELATNAATGADATIEHIVGTTGSLATVLCFSAPVALLSRLFKTRPTHQRVQTTHRLAENGVRTTSNDPTCSREAPFETTRTMQLLSLAVLWLALVTNTSWLRTSDVWTPLALGSVVVLRLLLLPSLLGLVYYHERFLFFDVLVKRGVLWSSVSVLVTALVFTTVPVMLRTEVGYLALVSVGSVLFINGSVRLVSRCDSWLDRILFHRPDYRFELQSMSAAMARCSTATALTESVTSYLTRALRAAVVYYSLYRTTTGGVVVAVGTPEHSRGFLTLGPRARGQHYGSEDLTFVDAVAAQFAGHLEAFEAQESSRLAAAAELRALRAQINPHFLFNALSTLAELSRGQPEAERTILNLSQMFRYALESTQSERVPLDSEIDAIRAYLEIEATRFEEHLRFTIEIPEDARHTLVPPMLVQPLVENAVKHGLSSKMGGGTVVIAAARDNGHLHITVQDDGVGFDPHRSAQGVGLNNVRARVEQTGGACHVQSMPGVGTRVTLAVVTS